MEVIGDLKSSEISPRDTDCNLSLESEIKLSPNITRNDLTCIKQNSTLNNKLPQRNSGFEKNIFKKGRKKPQMLGDLTFRQIAKKRKEKFKSDLVKNEVPSSILTSVPVSESLLKPDKRDEGESLKDVTTYINPHILVGKTITIQQGEIRHIKFLSQDSKYSASNKNLLKLDALQLTPKIIVRKCEQKCLPSKQALEMYKDRGKIDDGLHEEVSFITNLDELNSQLRSSKIRGTQNCISSITDFGREEPQRKHARLTMPKASSEKDIYNCPAERHVSFKRVKEDNVAKCSFLSSSLDNLTILSQVACDELEMNKQLGTKEETNYLTGLNERVEDPRYSLNKTKQYVSQDLLYQQKDKLVKELNCNRRLAKVSPMKNKASPSEKDVNIGFHSPEVSKRTSQEKPMFAWCTQYITHRRSRNTNVSSFVENHKQRLAKKQLFAAGKINKSNSLKDGQIKTINRHDLFKVHSCDNPKIQFQKKDDPHKNEKVRKELLNCIEKSNNPHALEENSKVILPPKPQLCCKNEVKNESLTEIAELAVKPLFPNNKVKSLPELNDEVVIVKEILVTKSLNCTASPHKNLNILKTKHSNEHLICETDSHKSAIETLSARKVLTEIPANEEQTNTSIHPTNSSHQITEPCHETARPCLKNTLAYITTKDMNGIKNIKKIRKRCSTPLKKVKRKSKSSLAKRKGFSQSHCRLENTIKDNILEKTSYPIRECFVLIERLNYTVNVNRSSDEREIKMTTRGMSNNKMYFDDSSSLDISLKNDGEQNDTFRMPNHPNNCKDREPSPCIKICEENLETALQLEKNTFHPEKKNYDKNSKDQNSIYNAKTGCKRKRLSKEDVKSFRAFKKVKQPQRRQKKQFKNHALQSKSTKEGSKTTTKLDDAQVKITFQHRSNSYIKIKQNCGALNKKPLNRSVSSTKKSVHISPKKNFSGTREIYSLLTDFANLGCSIQPERKLRCRLAKSLKLSGGNTKSLKDEKDSNPVNYNQLVKNKSVIKKSHTCFIGASSVESNIKLQSVQKTLDQSQNSLNCLSVNIPQSCQQNVKKDPSLIPVRENNKQNKSFKSKNNSKQRNNKNNPGKVLATEETMFVPSDFITPTPYDMIESSSYVNKIDIEISTSTNENYSNNKSILVHPLQNNLRCSKRLIFDKSNKTQQIVSSSSAKVKKVLPLRKTKKNSQEVGKSPLLRSKLKMLNFTDFAPDVQTSKADSITDVNSLRKGPSRRPGRQSFNSHMLNKKNSNLGKGQSDFVDSRYKLNDQTLLDMVSVQKVTKTQDTSKEQVNNCNISTIQHFDSQEVSQHSKFVKCSVNFNKRLKKQTQFQIPPETSLSNNQLTDIKILGNKSTIDNESSTSPSVDIPTIHSQKCKGTTEVSCTSSSPYPRNEKDVPMKNQMANRPMEHDKMRLLIMEQLKKSRRGIK